MKPVLILMVCAIVAGSVQGLTVRLHGPAIVTDHPILVSAFVTFLGIVATSRLVKGQQGTEEPPPLEPSDIYPDDF